MKTFMQPDDVRLLVDDLRKDIENQIGWEEDWHIREDNIIWEVIREISKGNPNAKGLADEAMEANKLKFEKYFT